MHIETFRDPILSCAQSALHQVLARRGLEGTENLSVDEPEMQAVVAYAKRRSQSVAVADAFVQPSRGDEAVAVTPTTCAELYVEYCIASWFGPEARAQQLHDELKFSECDPLWLEAIADYELFKHSHENVPYVTQQAPAGIHELASDQVTIALVADWGTGTAAAENVLKQAASLSPDLVIHMGDIYYAGTPGEDTSNFLTPVTAVFPGASGKPGLPVYVLAGNHDYYAGGAGYFGALATLGAQTASYFCLRTANWQVVCLDTGLNDRDPFTVLSNITYLPDDQTLWLEAVMESASDRRTILLTHHQLYSGAGAVGESSENDQTVAWGVNPRLYQQLERYFDQIALWLWGHEHNTVVFYSPVSADGRLQLPEGRCIGSGAIPMLLETDPYTPEPGLVAPNGVALPQMNLGYMLGHDDVAYNHGFAMLSLGPAGATVDYYCVLGAGARPRCCSPNPSCPRSRLPDPGEPGGARPYP